MVLAWSLVLQLLQLHADAPHELWDYKNTSIWKSYFPLCDGPLQSPINIIPGSGKPRVEKLQVDWAPGIGNSEIEGINNGRTIKIFIRPENVSRPLMTLRSHSRPLFGVYHFAELDLHWGEGQGDEGSEHSFNGKFYDAEAQLVFYNAKYGTYNEAKKYPGGLAIVAVPLTGNNNPRGLPFFPLFSIDLILEDLAMPGATINLNADITPWKAMMKTALSKFYMYYGSMTKPPCNPVVLWIVSATEFEMEWEFLLQLYAEIFSNEALTDKMIRNKRPIQPSAGRQVTTYISGV
ncbi:Carbonic anhydrase 1 [Amphibalanus amphitrite]|uniref:carbonic anhydrase n=1 Tax=Amphibalanus amphitrite TaxID=1232801 RepID=A0A6A4VAJ5_AMPAM|nr:carbonic anhydrase 1-like [Amphibalanus amphitrite]XP_043239723.1 carbonic anhydrase 1-like [Amphibalanus amphitrite]KAF0287462.1 Carbonic anhydrase 1 [Amphibalanus amphitrite]KAF0293307.1 Carbonic anhydrase 1 [Amphibalanus amphitrite]